MKSASLDSLCPYSHTFTLKLAPIFWAKPLVQARLPFHEKLCSTQRHLFMSGLNSQRMQFSTMFKNA